MKKYLLIPPAIAFCFTLSGCNKNKNPEDYVTAENFVVHTSTTLPDSAKTFLDTNTVSPEQKKLTYALNGTTVELLINDESVQSIENYYVPDTSAIVVADFNFDGYDDIFIPFSDPTDYGCYYCYNYAENYFYEDNQLNNIGTIMTVSDNKTLILDQSDDSTERTIEYAWFGSNLKAVQKTEIYEDENKVSHKDVYKYDENGMEYLFESA